MEEIEKDDYVPFGEEWEKEINKMSKKFIIDMHRNVCKELQEAKRQIKILTDVTNNN